MILLRRRHTEGRTYIEGRDCEASLPYTIITQEDFTTVIRHFMGGACVMEVDHCNGLQFVRIYKLQTKLKVKEYKDMKAYIDRHKGCGIRVEFMGL